MRKTIFSILILTGLFLIEAGCMAERTPAPIPIPTLTAVPATVEPSAAPVVDNLPAEEPLSLPLTGAEVGGPPDRAAALMIEEQRSAGTFSIVPVSAGSGKAVEGLEPLVLDGEIAYGFSHDRSQMAFLSNRTEGCEGYCLRIMDLQAWEEMIDPIPVEKSRSVWFTIPAFDEASSVLPLLVNRQTDTASEVLLVDRSRGSVTARMRMKANLFQAARTPDGNLAVHGVQYTTNAKGPQLYIALLDGDDLSLLWENTVPEITLVVGEVNHTDPMQGQYYEPAKVFARDGSKLFLVAGDKDLLVTVDFVERSVTIADIQPRMSLLEHLLTGTVRVAHAKTLNGMMKNGVLSRDGRYLYVVGEETKAIKNDRDEYEAEFYPLGLQVIDTQDGTLVREVESAAGYVMLSADGQTLFLHGWRRVKGGNAHPWTDVMEADTLRVVQRLEGTAYPSQLLDGSQAWLVVQGSYGATTTIDLYRPGDTAPRIQIVRHGYVDWAPIP